MRSRASSALRERRDLVRSVRPAHERVSSQPAKLGEAEILAAIEAAITETGATGPADMGKLMGALKPRLAGQADMGQVSALVKKRFAG